MSFRFKSSDLRILTSLAECRVLRVPQIMSLHPDLTSKQSAGRRLSQLEKKGLVDSFARGYGNKRGRPEKVYTIGKQGFEILLGEKILNENARFESINGRKTQCLNHQLLLNWFRIHLNHLSDVLPRLNVSILTESTSSFSGTDGSCHTISDSVDVPGIRKPVCFIPDAVFKITDNETGNNLLFFLEVDMGTETVASPKRKQNDVRQKIINYQNYFKSEKYKRYSHTWRCGFNGFRLLLFTHSSKRLMQLSRLVTDMPPSDFVWLTDYTRLTTSGLASAIWSRGGKSSVPLQSILGPSLSKPPPLPEVE